MSSRKFVIWSFDLQCDGIMREGVWELIRFRWGHEGGVFILEWMERPELAPTTSLFPYTTLFRSANKGPSSQSYGFSSSHVRMWELDCEESWAPKN